MDLFTAESDLTCKLQLDSATPGSWVQSGGQRRPLRRAGRAVAGAAKGQACPVSPPLNNKGALQIALDNKVTLHIIHYI